MDDLIDMHRQATIGHLRSTFASGELTWEAAVSKMEMVQTEG
jgi:hypothetical protein